MALYGSKKAEPPRYTIYNLVIKMYKGSAYHVPHEQRRILWLVAAFHASKKRQIFLSSIARNDCCRMKNNEN